MTIKQNNLNITNGVSFCDKNCVTCGTKESSLANFDADNFLCKKIDLLCTNVLGNICDIESRLRDWLFAFRHNELWQSFDRFYNVVRYILQLIQ
jgi:hypothetical protein